MIAITLWRHFKLLLCFLCHDQNLQLIHEILLESEMMVHHPLFEMPPTFPEVALVRMQWGSEYKKEHRTDRELFLHSEKFDLEDIFLLGMLSVWWAQPCFMPYHIMYLIKAFPRAFVRGLHILFNAHIMLPTMVAPRSHFWDWSVLLLFLPCRLTAHSHNSHLHLVPFIRAQRICFTIATF